MRGLHPGLGFGGIAAAAASSSLYVQQANLAFLWDADAIAASDGATQATWTDTIGGIVATAPATRLPSFKTNVMNGKSGMRFIGGKFLDIGRPTALMNTVDGDYTAIVVCTNLVAGANALSAAFGEGNGTGSVMWMVANTTNLGFQNGAIIPNPLATTDLYVIFYTRRKTVTTPANFGRQLAGCNGTSFFPGTSGLGSGSGLWGIGTGDHAADGSSGNAYSFRGDIMKIAIWNRTLSYTDIIRQTRKFFTFYGKPMPWAGRPYFILGDGDSITAGVGGQNNACYPWNSAANLGLKYGQWSNNGRPSFTMTQIADDFAFQYTGLSGADALGIPVVCTWFEYANQVQQTIGRTDTIRYAAQLKALDPTMKSIFCTATALGVGDSDLDAGGNITAKGQFRLDYNQYFRDNPFNMDYILDFGADAAVGVPGASPLVGATGPNFALDGKHPYGFVGQSTANGYAHMGLMHSTLLTAQGLA